MSNVLVGLNAPKPVADEKGHFTCRLTVVSGGYSDRVMKIYPATYHEERVDLDIQPGQARMKAIKRFLDKFVPRGEAVPEPVAYHSGKDLHTIVINEEDIPVATLEEGAVFEVLKPEPRNLPKNASPLEAIQKRQDAQDARMDKMVEALNNLASAIAGKEADKPKVGRPKKNQES